MYNNVEGGGSAEVEWYMEKNTSANSFLFFH